LLRRKSLGLANDHGYNDAWLGLPNSNPHAIGSLEYVEYNRGFVEGEELADEFISVSYITPQYMYPDGDI
jgi:hypothetical protein